MMRTARGDWAALCWLCWSAGLDEVTMPDRLVERPALGRAVGMAIERHWRCRDRLTTAGLRALTQGVPSFSWEGMEIDVMPRLLVEICHPGAHRGAGRLLLALRRAEPVALARRPAAGLEARA